MEAHSGAFEAGLKLGFNPGAAETDLGASEAFSGAVEAALEHKRLSL
jgi:hypothetical protein